MLLPTIPNSLALAILRPYLSDSVRSVADSISPAMTPNERSEVNEIIVRDVARGLTRLEKELGNKLLPKPPFQMHLKDLDIGVRTYNCLATLGISDDIREIGELTFGNILKTRNFGAKCLVELLNAIEKSGSAKNETVVESLLESVDATVLTNDDWIAMDIAIKENTRISYRIRSKYFPPLPKGFRLEPLNLSSRTLKSMETLGLVDGPDGLSEFTINDILRIPNMGRKSLTELILKLQPVLFRPVEVETSEDCSDDLMLEASILMNLTGANKIAANDIRFGGQIQNLLPDAGTARECCERILNGEQTCIGIKEAQQHVQFLRREIENASLLTFEKEIQALVSAIERDSRYSSIFFSRYGINGTSEKTLQEVGDIYGITRERVRQICGRICKDLQGDFYTPILDKVISSIDELCPTSVKDAKKALLGKGIIESEHTLEGLHFLAGIFDKDLPFLTSELGGNTFYSRQSIAANHSKLLSIAKTEIRTWGLALIDNIFQKARSSGIDATDSILRGILVERNDFRWLDDKEGWFWLKKVGKNRLFNQIEKVLQVTDSIDVANLRQAARRNYRMKGFAPPRAILLEYCEQHDDLEVNGHIVSLRSNYRPKRVFAETEALLIDILRANGSVMKREEFENQALLRGMNRTTFYVCLDNSPIITRFARGVYGLTGTTVQPGLIESLKPKMRRTKVLKDFGWNNNGGVWVKYKLSANAINSGLITLPAYLKGFVNPPYQISREGKRIVSFGNGTLSVGNALTKLDAKPEDILIIVFDEKSKTANLHLESTASK